LLPSADVEESELSSTSADGSKHGSTSARCCNYSFECASDDGWGYHPKRVELSAEM